MEEIRLGCPVLVAFCATGRGAVPVREHQTLTRPVYYVLQEIGSEPRVRNPGATHLWLACASAFKVRKVKTVMTHAENTGSTWWPSVSDQKGARKAAHEGAGAAVFIAAVTTLFAVLSIFDIQIIPGFSPFSLVDAGLFAIVAWRIYKMSRAWAVVGLFLHVVERAYSLYLHGITRGAGMVVGAILILGVVNGVRGTFAYSRLSASQQLLEVKGGS